jgi:hypothetical protein
MCTLSVVQNTLRYKLCHIHATTWAKLFGGNIAYPREKALRIDEGAFGLWARPQSEHGGLIRVAVCSSRVFLAAL